MFYVTILPSPNDYGRDFTRWAASYIRRQTLLNGSVRFEFDTEAERDSFVKLYRSSKWLPYEFTVSHEVIEEWSINTPQGLENTNG